MSADNECGLMEFAIAPAMLVEILKRMLPHTQGRKLVKGGPLVMLVANDSALDLVGQFDNVWCIPAEVRVPGGCAVHVKTMLDQLKTYEQKKPLVFRLHVDGLKFGTTKLALHEMW